MGQPLTKRLNSNKEQVIQDVMLYGRSYTMTKWGVKDYSCCCAWVREVSGEENLGLMPELDLGKGKDLGEQLIEAMANYVAKNEAQKKELLQQVAHLQALLGERHIKNATLAAPLLNQLKMLANLRPSQQQKWLKPSIPGMTGTIPGAE